MKKIKQWIRDWLFDEDTVIRGNVTITGKVTSFKLDTDLIKARVGYITDRIYENV